MRREENESLKMKLESSSKEFVQTVIALSHYEKQNSSDFITMLKESNKKTKKEKKSLRKEVKNLKKQLKKPRAMSNKVDSRERIVESKAHDVQGCIKLAKNLG